MKDSSGRPGGRGAGRTKRATDALHSSSSDISFQAGGEQRLARIHQELQPLYAWIRSNCNALKASNRWPLRQEDVPPDLLPLYQVYRSNKSQLQAFQKQQQKSKLVGKEWNRGLHAGPLPARAPLQPVHPHQQPPPAPQQENGRGTIRPDATSLHPGAALTSGSMGARGPQGIAPAAAPLAGASIALPGDGWATLRCSTKVGTAKRQQKQQQQEPLGAFSSPLAGTPKGSAVLLASLRSPGSCSRLGPTPPRSAMPPSVNREAPASPIGRGLDAGHLDDAPSHSRSRCARRALTADLDNLLQQEGQQQQQQQQQQQFMGQLSTARAPVGVGVQGELQSEAKGVQGTPAAKQKPSGAAEEEQLEWVPATGERPRVKGRACGSEDEEEDAALPAPLDLERASQQQQQQQQQQNTTPSRLKSPFSSTLRRRALFQSHHGGPGHGLIECKGEGVVGVGAEVGHACPGGALASSDRCPQQQQQQQQQFPLQGVGQVRGSAVLLHHMALQDRSPVVKPSRVARGGRGSQQADYVDYFKLHRQVGEASTLGAASDVAGRHKSHQARVPRSPALARTRSHPRARKNLMSLQSSTAAAAPEEPAALATLGSCCKDINPSSGTLSASNKQTALTQAATQHTFNPFSCSTLLGVHPPSAPAAGTAAAAEDVPSRSAAAEPSIGGVEQEATPAAGAGDAYTRLLQQQLAAAQAQVAALQAQMAGAAAGGQLAAAKPQQPQQQQQQQEQGDDGGAQGLPGPGYAERHNISELQVDACTPTRHVSRATSCLPGLQHLQEDTSARSVDDTRAAACMGAGLLGQQPELRGSEGPLAGDPTLAVPLQVSVHAPRPRHATPVGTAHAAAEHAVACTPTRHLHEVALHREACTPTQHASQHANQHQQPLSPELTFTPGLVRPGLHACRRKGLTFQAAAAEHQRCAALSSPLASHNPLLQGHTSSYAAAAHAPAPTEHAGPLPASLLLDPQAWDSGAQGGTAEAQTGAGHAQAMPGVSGSVGVGAQGACAQGFAPVLEGSAWGGTGPEAAEAGEPVLPVFYDISDVLMGISPSKPPVLPPSQQQQHHQQQQGIRMASDHPGGSQQQQQQQQQPCSPASEPPSAAAEQAHPPAQPVCHVRRPQPCSAVSPSSTRQEERGGVANHVRQSSRLSGSRKPGRLHGRAAGAQLIALEAGAAASGEVGAATAEAAQGQQQGMGCAGMVASQGVGDAGQGLVELGPAGVGASKGAKCGRPRARGAAAAGSGVGQRAGEGVAKRRRAGTGAVGSAVAGVVGAGQRAGEGAAKRRRAETGDRSQDTAATDFEAGIGVVGRVAEQAPAAHALDSALGSADAGNPEATPGTEEEMGGVGDQGLLKMRGAGDQGRGLGSSRQLRPRRVRAAATVPHKVKAGDAGRSSQGVCDAGVRGSEGEDEKEEGGNGADQEGEGSEFGVGSSAEEEEEEDEEAELSEEWLEDSPVRPAKRRAAASSKQPPAKAARTRGSSRADAAAQPTRPGGAQQQAAVQESAASSAAATAAAAASTTCGLQGVMPRAVHEVRAPAAAAGPHYRVPNAAKNRSSQLAGRRGTRHVAAAAAAAAAVTAGEGGGEGGSGSAGAGSQGGRVSGGYAGVRASAPVASSAGARGGAAKKRGVGSAAAKGVSKGRDNFVRYNTKGGKGSFAFESRSAASGRLKASRTRLRRLHGGKVIRNKWTAPSMAGQGADFLEGFKEDKRCFRCGGQGHWATDCPFDKGNAPEILQAAADDAADAEAEDAAKGAIPGASPNTKARRQAAHTTAVCAGTAGLKQATAQLQTKQQQQQQQQQQRQSSREPFQLSALLLPDLASEIAEACGLLQTAAPPPVQVPDDAPSQTGQAHPVGSDRHAAAASSRALHACTSQAGPSASQAAPSACMGPSQALHSAPSACMGPSQSPSVQMGFTEAAGPASHATDSQAAQKTADAMDATAAGPLEQAAASVGAAAPQVPAAAAGGHAHLAPASTAAQHQGAGSSTSPTPHRLSDEQLRRVLQCVFGHAQFRGRQLEVVRAVLAEQSLLAVLPTGAGKSLCYQLPAVLLPGVTLVVSPLLALMRDQLDRLPPAVPGAMLWGGQTRLEAEQVLEDAACGAIKLLYVAPEKLLNPSVLSALRKLERIPLVCVDEAHCVSEWGHSFRPAYFRLGHILRTVLRPHAVLGLTATATRNTQAAISQVLGLPPSSIIRELPLRENIRLQVIHMDNGTHSGRSRSWLLAALRSGSLSEVQSVIAYVAFQAQADEVADRLKQAGINAASYHAGKHMDERLSVQAAFCSGSTRVVVATIAFGMGVDKAEVGAVVHLTLPHSLEDYVQQVGRAGRDGKPARAVLVLDRADYLKLRSLSHKGAAELQAVRQLCQRVFAPLEQLEKQANQASAAGASMPMRGAFGVMPISEAMMELDLGEEAMETVLSYLQGHDGRGALAALPITSAFVDVYFHRTPPAQLATRSPVVAALLAAKPRVTKGSHRVPMSRLVASAGMSSSAVMYHLADLAKRQEIHFEASKAKALSWRLAPQPQPDIEELAKSLHARLTRQLKVSVRRLDVVWLLMATAAQAGEQPLQEQVLRAHTSTYFDNLDDIPSLNLVTSLPPRPTPALACDNSSAQPCPRAQSLDLSSSPPRDAAEPGLAASGPADEGGAGTQVSSASDSRQADGSGVVDAPPDATEHQGARTERNQAHSEASDAAGKQGLGGQDQEEAGSGGQGAKDAGQDELDGAVLPQLPVVLFPERAQAQVSAFLRAHRQRIVDMAKRGQQVGGIAVARIFHGLSTPAFPVQQWAKCGFWGQFTAWDFSAIAEVARTELAKKG